MHFKQQAGALPRREGRTSGVGLHDHGYPMPGLGGGSARGLLQARVVPSLALQVPK